MYNNQHGFTLIELMVTLAVMAVVLGVAIPSFNSQIRNNRSLAVGEEFVSALNFARSEAVKRAQPVVLCASNAAQTACDSDWSKGWLVATDTAAETATSVTVGEVLRVWEAPPAGASLSVRRADSGSSTTGTATGFIRYEGRGALARISNQVKVIQAVVYTSGCTGKAKQELGVSVAGSVSAKRVDC